MRLARRAQRARDSKAGQIEVRLKLPKVIAERLLVATRQSDFFGAPTKTLEAMVVDIDRYAQLKLLCWNRRARIIFRRKMRGVCTSAIGGLSIPIDWNQRSAFLSNCYRLVLAGQVMGKYQRSRHRAVSRILERLDARVLREAKCYFGGGTRIALELNEYRESEGIDFICSNLVGYRTLRETIDNCSLGALLPDLRPDLSLLRDVRADQYGIRTIIGVQGEPVKFEILLEARIQVAALKVKGIPVPVLDRTSCFAEKWLANADRWNDSAVLSRDAIDLAFMLSAWSIDEALAGARLASDAYGYAIGRATDSASTKLLKDAAYRRQCIEDLGIIDSTRLLSGLRLLVKIAKELA